MMRTKKQNRGWGAWIAGAAISLLMGVSAVAQLTPPRSSPILINDNPALSPPYRATPYPSEIEIKDTVGTIQRLQVVVNGLSHSYSRDVAILLVGPNGNSVVLMSDVGNSGVASVDLVFADDGQTISPDVALRSGTYKPLNNQPGLRFPNPGGGADLVANRTTLTDAFRGASANGVWRLYVLDDKPFDAGSIANWTLNVETMPVLTLSQTAIAMDENTSTNVTITVRDDSTAAANLRVTATAANKTLLPDNTGLIISGTGLTRTLTIRPTLFEFGQTTVTVSVNDGVETVTSTINVNVRHVNTPPTVTLSAPSVTIQAGTLNSTLIAFPQDRDNPANFASSVVLSVESSSDANVVPPGGVTFNTNAPFARNFSVFGARPGTSTLVIRVTDDQGATGTATLNVTVTPATQPMFVNTASIDLPTTTGTETTSQIQVSGVNGDLGKVAVTLVGLRVTNPNTLRGTLTGPNGIGPIALAPTPATSSANRYGAITFSEIGGSTLPANSTHTNVLIYTAGLTNQVARNPNGVWTLTLTGGEVDANSVVAGGWALRVFPAPQILNVSAIEMPEDTAAQTFTFTVADQDGTVTNVNATVLNLLAEVRSVVLSGNLATVTIAGNPNRNGPSKIRLTARDNHGLLASRDIDLTVTPVNDPPDIQFIEKQITYFGTPITGAFVISDVDNPVSELVVTKSSNNPKVIPDEAIVLTAPEGTASGNRQFAIFPVAPGTNVSVTITVTDPSKASDSTTFPVQVQDAGNRVWTAAGSIVVAANSTATPFYPSTNRVSGMRGTVAEVQVTLFNINAQSPGDLRVLLVGPNDEEVLLMGNVVGNNTLTGTTLVFTETGAQIPASAAVTSGVYRPSRSAAFTGNLTAPAPAGPYGSTFDVFEGINPNGDWKLYVDSRTITGSLGKETRIDGGWALSIRTTPAIEDFAKAVEIPQRGAGDGPTRIPIVVGDPQPGVNLTVTATPANTAIIESVQVTGLGGTRELVISPVFYAVGDTTITVTATDVDGNTDTSTFDVKVIRRDLPPVISAVGDVSTPAATEVGPIEFTVWDPQWNATSNNEVAVDVTAANPALVNRIRVERVGVSQSGPRPGTNTFRLWILPAGVETGTTKITISAQGRPLKSTREFTLTITPALAFGNPKPIVIPVGFPVDELADPYPSVITVPAPGQNKVGGLVNKVTVTLAGLTHGFPEDVSILLQGPNGRSVVLMHASGGENDMNNVRLTFSDDAEAPLPDSTAIVEDTYRPAGVASSVVSFPLPAPASEYRATLTEAFRDADPNGDWKLFVMDRNFPDSGAIENGWLISIETKPAFVGVRNIEMSENQAFPLTFNVTDGRVAGKDITVTATVNDAGKAFISESSLGTVTVNEGQRTITILPITNQPSATYWQNWLDNKAPTNGTAVITLTANNGGVTTSQSFEVLLRYVNQLPYIVPATANDYTVPENATLTLDYAINDVDSRWTRTNTLVYFDNGTLIPDKRPDNIDVQFPYAADSTQSPRALTEPGTWPNIRVVLKPASNRNGTGRLYFVQFDQTGQARTNVQTITIESVAQVPTLELPEAGSVKVRAGASGSFTVKVGSPEVNPANLSVTATSLDTQLIPNNSRYLSVVSGTDQRIIRFTTIGTQSGTARIQITVDDGIASTAPTTATFNVVVEGPEGISTQFANLTAIRQTGGLRSYDIDLTAQALLGDIQEVAVLLDGVVHPNPADLDIMLEAVKRSDESTNKAVMLMSAAGNGFPLNGVRLTFSPNPDNPVVPQTTAITEGVYQPAIYSKVPPPAPAPVYFTANLNDLQRLNPNRVWRLWINNRGGSEVQLLGGWELTILTAPRIEVVEALPAEIDANEKATMQIRVRDDYGTDPKKLVLSATSSDTVLLPIRNIDFGDSAANTRTITLSPAPYQAGEVDVVFTVTREGVSRSLPVENLVVNAVNDPPTFSRLERRTIPENTPVTVQFVVSDPDSQLRNITLSATTSDEAIISRTNILFFGASNPYRGLPANTVPQSSLVDMRISPTQSANGTVTITITATDEMAGVRTNTTSTTLVVDVQKFNWPPVFTGIADRTMAGGSTAEFPFQVSSATRPIVSITVTGTSDNQAIVRNENITITPATSTNPDRVLRIQTEPWAGGNDPRTVRITLAGTDGVTNSSTSFVLTVVPPRAQVFSNLSPITIVDNNRANPYPSTIPVSGLQGNIRSVRATINGFTHSFPSDAGILLVSPSGDKVVLMNKAGTGSAAVNGANFTFDQAATSPIPATGNLATGSYRPADYLSGYTFPTPAPAREYATSMAAFNGDLANGNWSLYVVDTVAGDSGVITNGWSLSIETEPRFVGLNDIAVNEGESATMRFTIADDARFSPSYTLSGSSSAPNVIPTSGIVFDTSTGTNRTVTITPTPGQFGSNIVVTVTVRNSDGQTVNDTFEVDVIYRPTPPNITVVSDQTAQAGVFSTVVPFSYWDVHYPTNVLQVTVQSSNPTVLPVSGIKVNPTSLILVPVAGQTGSSTVTITVANADGLTASTTFVVTVVPPTAGQVFAQNGTINIPASGTATPYPSDIVVSGVSGNVSKVTVGLNGFSHSFPSDVNILLVGPQGQRVVLLSRAGAGVAVNNTFITFDDAAPTAIPQYAQITDGTFKPSDYKASDFFPNAPVGPYANELSVFNGVDPNGTWSLYVYDEIAPDGGSIARGWSLNLGTGVQPSAAIGVRGPTLRLAQDMTLHVTGTPGVDYTIQSSSDLNNWSDAGTVTTDDTGKAEYNVTPEGGANSRLFRVIAK